MRINIYLDEETIKIADDLARKLSYELSTTLNRSNLIGIAIKALQQQSDTKKIVADILAAEKR